MTSKLEITSGCKIPKFKLQTYAFVYQRLMDFPQGRFDYETLTTINFFESIHKIINVKIHLHHSHLTGSIYGYAHDFCNRKVRENQNQFSCIAHNFFLSLTCFFKLKELDFQFGEQKI